MTQKFCPLRKWSLLFFDLFFIKMYINRILFPPKNLVDLAYRQYDNLKTESRRKFVLIPRCSYFR